MSSLLEQAIVDAKALKEAALKNAENLVIEKYSAEVRESMANLLEQEDPFAALGGEADPVAADPMAAAPDETPGEVNPIVKQIPDAFMSDEDSDEVVRIDLDQLRMELGVDTEEDADAGAGDMDMDMDLGLDAAPETAAATEPAPTPAEPAGLGGLDALQEEIEDMEEEIDLDLDGLLEALKVDIKPVKSGWAGTPDSVLEEYEDMILARENDDEVKEEHEAIRSRVAELQKENKILGSAAYKLQKENDNLRNAVHTLQEKVESTNVSNAKLLYINQALENASLNERQKKTIVEAISKADSVKEAKMIYETLQSTINSTHKKEERLGTLNEAVTRKSSLLMAASKQQEKQANFANPFFERMQQLAGINKQ